MKSSGDLSLAGPIGQYRPEEWFRQICVIGAIPWRFPKSSADLFKIHRQFIAARYSNG
jgi:hypothetical protein